MCIRDRDSDEEEGKGFRVLLKPLVRLFDKLLFAKVRKARLKRRAAFLPRARIPCSIFFLKFFAKAGTLSIRYGLNSFISVSYTHLRIDLIM